MKQTLTTLQAAEILFQDQCANWSSEAALALVIHYEQLEEELGQDIDFDPVAIRCDWSEYTSEKEALNAYDMDEILSLRYETEVIELDNGHILVRGF